MAVFNLEMGAEQLAMRILSSVGQLEGFKLRTANLMNKDWKRINEAVSQLSNTNLVIDDTPGITIGEIRAKCRRLASSEKGLALVVIDYLQLISGGKNYGVNTIIKYPLRLLSIQQLDRTFGVLYKANNVMKNDDELKSTKVKLEMKSLL